MTADSPIDSAPFDELSQDRVIDAVESLGYLSDLRVFPLNSYENRVYQVGIEDAEPLIAKFYRPNRWSDEQIHEEHEFSQAATDMEIPFISPLQLTLEGSDVPASLFHYKGFRFSLYQRRGGHAPELDDLDTLHTLGQHLGRLHALGATKDFHHRPQFSLKSFAIDSRSYLLDNDFIPRNLKEAYAAISEYILESLNEQYDENSFKRIRLHGDCHPGNIISR
ncbi:MAG: Ser/Thr protein kinase RdoA (MazF antagonist), partial [Flavobacteriales bacterium]